MRILFWTILVISQLSSIGFAWWALSRLFLYINAYRFDESQYTLLFGFIHLRWIAGLYLMSVVAFALFTTFYSVFVF